ncbi:5288_t:CDS:2 [Funneliformis geosporum]|nr:5288_t:CDS:2 [Funneliformis geosporum]
MSGKINFIIQSEAWRHPDTQGDKNVYGVKEFYYKKDEFKKFRYIKIGKRKEQYIKDKNLRGSNDVTVDKLTGKNGKIFFGYNSTEYLTNEITFKEVNVIQNIGEDKGYCVVEGIDWERAAIYTERKEFTEAGETNTPIPENTAETHTTETEDTSEPEATGTPPKPETTETSEQTPEPNTTPPPKPISVYDYFEKKMADEDRNLSGLVNENHVDNKRKFIKYDFLKSKLEEIYPQNQGSQNGNPSSGDRLAQTRKNAIQTITVALNLEPAVKESELSSEFHG